jgi:hypothetical protein
MRLETAKLPEWHSYPLRPSVFETALAEAGIAVDMHLIRSPVQLLARISGRQTLPRGKTFPFAQLQSWGQYPKD